MSVLSPPTYSYGIDDVPGSVAVSNFVSFFNPPGSGKIMLVFQATVGAYAVGVSSTDTSMSVRLLTSASGGTLVDPDTIYPLRSDWPNPKVEVRIDNPTIGLGAPATLVSFPPAITSGIGGGVTSSVTTPTATGVPYGPGEGLVFRTEAGNVNQRWDVLFIWAEVDI